jgi:alanyl-tRNA synthetase
MTNRFNAIVTDIRLASRVEGRALWHIALDHSLFSEHTPTGTLTARAASGAVLVVTVLAVERDNQGDLWHVTEKPLQVGASVEAEVL